MPTIVTLPVLEHWLCSPYPAAPLGPLATLCPSLFSSLTSSYFFFGFQLTDLFLEESDLCSMHTPQASGLSLVEPGTQGVSHSSLLHACVCSRLCCLRGTESRAAFFCCALDFGSCIRIVPAWCRAGVQCAEPLAGVKGFQ